MRNTKWIRPSEGEITSVWSVATETVREETVPDWCGGWLYVTTPQVSPTHLNPSHI